MEFKLEDLIDLEAARIANAEFEREKQDEFEAMLQAQGDLPGQLDVFDQDIEK